MLQLDCGRSIPFVTLAQLHGDTWLTADIPYAVLACRYRKSSSVVVPHHHFPDSFSRFVDGDGREADGDERVEAVWAGGAGVRFVPVVHNTGAHWIGPLADLSNATVTIYNSMGDGQPPSARSKCTALALGRLFNAPDALQR